MEFAYDMQTNLNDQASNFSRKIEINKHKEN